MLHGSISIADAGSSEVGGVKANCPRGLGEIGMWSYCWASLASRNVNCRIGDDHSNGSVDFVYQSGEEKLSAADCCGCP